MTIGDLGRETLCLLAECALRHPEVRALFWRQELNRLLEEKPVPEGQYGAWRAELKEQEAKFPLAFPQRDDVIVPQWAIKVLEQPCARCCVTHMGQAIPG